MKHVALILVGLVLSASDSFAFSIIGNGENLPTVQSALDGLFYVRATPASAFGTDGTTKVIKVERHKDVLIDNYLFYMRGELLLGWSPLVGQLCVIQVEPVRTGSSNQYRDVGAIDRIAFYRGGKEIKSYSRTMLQGLGLRRRVATLVHRIPGSFVVRGIVQFPSSNHYVLRINSVTVSGKVRTLDLNITTGESVVPPSPGK